MEYKEGFWNVNSVLLGGLGHDPVLPGAKSILWSNSGEKKKYMGPHVLKRGRFCSFALLKIHVLCLFR
jgi:hypothetical protein